MSTNNRPRKQYVRIYDRDNSDLVVGKLTVTDAERRVTDKVAEWKTDGSGIQLRAYKVISETYRPPSSGITFSEMETNAGLRGASQTEHLSEYEKHSRDRNGFSTEDYIERTRAKINWWPFIH